MQTSSYADLWHILPQLPLMGQLGGGRARRLRPSGLISLNFHDDDECDVERWQSQVSAHEGIVKSYSEGRVREASRW